MDKEQLSLELNRVLGTETDNIDFTRLKKDDLEKFYRYLTSEPLKFLQLGLKNLREGVRDRILKRPLGEVLETPTDKLFPQLSKRRKEGGGIFGLGILPTLGGKEQTEEEKEA